jgi:CheY-like chemotaxis protein
MSTKLCIAVADGNAHSRDTLQKWLTQLGHHAVAVESTAALSKLFHLMTPDVVICADELMDSEGFAVTIRRQRRLPLIVLTTDWHADRVARSLSSGALRYLKKPLHPLDLIAALSELPLAKHPARDGTFGFSGQGPRVSGRALHV